ncbi:MAG TPA: ATP-dependent DNA ligase, partial [Intrasporangium sp.]|nr:ATP-dependent DNA ligase [Intrasporangium sp.]
APVAWDEVDEAVPDDFTIETMPARFARLGDLHAGIDDAVFDISALLEWAERDEREGKDSPPDEEQDEE